MELKIIKDDEVVKMIRMAKSRAVCAGPGVTDTVAGALIEVRKRINRHRVIIPTFWKQILSRNPYRKLHV